MTDPVRPDHDALVRKNARTGLIVMGVVAFMVGLAFASVPLYDLFCRVTGFGGTPQVSGVAPGVILDREITVSFNTDTGAAMPWDFKPELPRVKVKIGQRALISFSAHNRTNAETAGTALYNVTPPKVGKYFYKTQCFCFDRQVLAPGQKTHFPVVFYIDPAIADDPTMNDVTDITLSYTFYEADSPALERAMEAYYSAK